MVTTVSNIWRHPVKGLGCEAVVQTALVAGETMPMDRVWAVMQAGAAFDVAHPVWATKKAFNQGAKSPSLMAVRASCDGDTITFTHPERPDLSVNPDLDPQALLDWVAPLIQPELPQPVEIAKLEGNGFSDQENPYISIIAKASLAELSKVAGRDLEQERFRANIWLDGVEPWQEFDWIGRNIRIGSTVLRVEARIGRCVATMANPANGVPDVDTLALLRQNWGHRDLGVFARVLKNGTVSLGDPMEVLP